VQHRRTCPPSDLGGYEVVQKQFEGIRGWIPHEEIEGQSPFTN
jgi:hypothetical protein